MTRSTKPCSKRNSRALEARRQFLRDGAGLDPRAGEPDEGVRFGEVDVAEDGIRGEHPARRRVAHHRDVRNTARAESLERRAGLGQLHERERALLHASAAGRRDDDERQSLDEGLLGRAGDLLADDGAHRAAHEPEVHHAQRDAMPVDRRGATNRGVAHPGRQLCRREAVGIRLLVDEPESIDALETGVEFSKTAIVHEEVDPCLCRQSEMMITGGTHAIGLLELLVEEHLRAGRALRPEVGG